MQAQLFTCWDCSHSLFKDRTASFLSLGHFRYFLLLCGVLCGLQGAQLQLATGHVVPRKRIISVLSLQTEHHVRYTPQPPFCFCRDVWKGCYIAIERFLISKLPNAKEKTLHLSTRESQNISLSVLLNNTDILQ